MRNLMVGTLFVVGAICATAAAQSSPYAPKAHHRHVPLSEGRASSEEPGWRLHRPGNDFGPDFDYPLPAPMLDKSWSSVGQPSYMTGDYSNYF